MTRPLGSVAYRSDHFSQGVLFPAATLAAVERWSRQRPLAPALLHKLHGRWGLYRWDDVARELAHLRDALIRESVGPQSRLAVCGALEPRLILLALAAHATGATVLTIDRHARGADLRALLLAAAPTHAFVQDRQIISAWIDSGHRNADLVPLYSTQSVRHDSGSWHILPLADLLGNVPEFIAVNKRMNVRGQPGLWTDEGTEWTEGLEVVLAEWLQTGATLVAPEVSAASVRDRQEVRFQRVVASAARRQQWRTELNARLAPTGSWTRWLIDWAGYRPGRFWSTWLLHRIDRLHGLPESVRRQGEGTA
jgi:hypothetical protein